MTAHAKADLVNEALDILATRLLIPCDIVDVCPRVVKGGVKRKFTRLRWGAFLLAYAPLEGFFNTITGYRDRTNRTLPLNLDKVVNEVKGQFPGASVKPRDWTSHTRGPSGKGSLSDWLPVSGRQPHANYLIDMKQVRDALAHGGPGYAEKCGSNMLWPTERHGYSLRLMGVEGFIHFAGDLAENVALDLLGPSAELPDWPMPKPSGVSAVNTPSRPRSTRGISTAP